MGILWGFFLGICGASLAWLLFFLGQLGNPTPGSQWVREGYAHKLAIAERIEGRKIVIVAGSMPLFGLNSGMLEARYGLPVVNLGVNAGLELPYILARARAALHPGDTALLPLEYPLYNYHDTVNPVMADYYLTEPAFLAAQPLRLRLKILFQTACARVLAGYEGLPEGFQVGGLYGPQHMDGRGDQTHSEVFRRPEAQLAALEAQEPARYGKDFASDNRAWDLLEDFRGWAEGRGICLIFIPPSMMFRRAYAEDPVERRFYEALAGEVRRHGMTFLGEPLSFMYAPDWYFDTNYHLTAEARDRHTERVIGLLGEDLGRHCP